MRILTDLGVFMFRWLIVMVLVFLVGFMAGYVHKKYKEHVNTVLVMEFNEVLEKEGL